MAGLGWWTPAVDTAIPLLKGPHRCLNQMHSCAAGKPQGHFSPVPASVEAASNSKEATTVPGMHACATATHA